jgi:hypothetical protein
MFGYVAALLAEFLERHVPMWWALERVERDLLKQDNDTLNSSAELLAKVISLAGNETGEDPVEDRRAIAAGASIGETPTGPPSAAQVESALRNWEPLETCPCATCSDPGWWELPGF